MTRMYEGGATWDTACRQILQVCGQGDLDVAQHGWAEALYEQFPPSGDVRVGSLVLGPLVDEASGDVVTDALLRVQGGDAVAVERASLAAWVRWQAVDDNGDEHDEPDLDDGWGDGVSGHPTATSQGVWIGLDVRGPSLVPPRRVVTSLLILGEELERHGAGPVLLVASHPDPAAPTRLDDGLRSTRAPSPDAVSPPAWLPPLTRVTKVRSGTPSEPPPFVVLASHGAWAWDRHHGLLRLPDPDVVPAASPITWRLQPDSLTPDGNSLVFRFEDSSIDLRDPAMRLQRIAYDVAAGVVTSAVPWHPQTTWAAGLNGPSLRATPASPLTQVGPNDDHYELLDRMGQVTHQVALPGRLLRAAFSPDRHLVLTEHELHLSTGVAVTDVQTGEPIWSSAGRGVRVCSTSPWSPDGSRCLVNTDPSAVAVLDLHDGTLASLDLDPLTPDAEPISHEPAEALGWLGGDGIAVSQRLGRRIRLAYQDLSNRYRVPILDLPLRAPSAEVIGIVLAADVVASDPSSVGFSGS